MWLEDQASLPEVEASSSPSPSDHLLVYTFASHNVRSYNSYRSDQLDRLGYSSGDPVQEEHLAFAQDHPHFAHAE
jgi:hypothetical protein